MPIARLALTVCLALLVAGVGVAQATPQRALDTVNLIRSEAGLPPVPEAIDAKGLADAAAGIAPGAPPSADPARTMEARLAPGEDLHREIGGDQRAIAMTLDPRLVGVAATVRTDRRLVIVFVRDLGLPWPEGVVVAHPRRVNPATADAVTVLSSAGAGGLIPVRLLDRRGRAVETTSFGAAHIEGGSQVSTLAAGEGSGLPYSQRLTVIAGSHRTALSTTAPPARYRGALRVKGLSRARQGLIRRTFNGTPALLSRRILPQMAGALEVRGPAPRLCGGARISCFWTGGPLWRISYSADVLDGSRAGRFIILHELGHAVSHAGLSKADRTRFSRMLRASRAHRCLANPLRRSGEPRTCVSDEEWFADEFARWAIGDRRMTSGYRTKTAFPPGVFARFLRDSFTLRA